MQKTNRSGATDEIIGQVFKRSLIVIALAALAVLTVVTAKTVLRKETIPLDVPAPVPVEVRTEAQAPELRFTDITSQAGIDFLHVTGAYGEKLLPETMGSGAAFFDYDNDGDQDLLLVNSDHWPDRRTDSEPRPTMKLYRNNGRGRFTDMTEAAGLAVPMYGMGAAVGDYDNDGDKDLLVTAYGPNRLFRNDAGVFTDVSVTAGVAGATDAWSTSAGFFDIDNDGDLDLFVANYVRWSRRIDLDVDFRLTGIGRAYGPPNAYEGTYNYLYRNDGNGRFSDISAASGIQVDNSATGRPMAKALGLAPVDLDGDGWLDVLVANDTVQNFLFRNRGDGSFEERGALYGVAFDRDGKATGAMGIDAAYFRNDAELGFAIGNFANEMSSLYVTRDAEPPLTDEAIVEGIGPATRLALTFGLFFFDYDLDGRLDLFHANGHLEGEINQVQSSQHYRQAPQLFWNCGDACRGRYLVHPAASAGDLATKLVGRGAAYADIDADGDLDLVITENGGPPLLLRNDQALGHHWLRVRLTGTTANRDAIGAWVEVRSGDMVQRRQVMPTRSYLSSVEPVLTFGLGKADRVDRLDVYWPGGGHQRLSDIAVDTHLEITQMPEEASEDA